MTKSNVGEWSATAANNTDIGGISINTGMSPANVDNAFREMMAQVAGTLGTATVTPTGGAVSFPVANILGRTKRVDNHANFAAAIAAAKAGAWPELVVPKGTWDFSTVTIDFPIRLVGEHPLDSILRTTHATANAITVSNVPNAPGVIFEGLGFKHSQARTGGYTIANNLGQGTWIKNCRFDGAYDAIGDIGLPSVGFRVHDTEMHGMVRHGIVFGAANGLQGSVYSEVVGVTIDAASDNNGGAGIVVSSAGDLTIDRVETLFMEQGLLVNPTTSRRVQLLQVSNCIFDSGDDRGIRVSPTGGTVHFLKVFNTWSATFDDAILLDGTGSIDAVELVGVTAGNCTNNGLWVNSGIVKHLSVLGGQYGQNVNSGVAISANVENLSIIGSQLGTGGQWTGNGFGLLVGSGVTFTSLFVENNRILGNTTPVSLPSGTSNSNVVSIRNNAGYATVNSGVVASQTTDGFGDLTISHGLSVTPRKIFVKVNGAGTPVLTQPHSEGPSVFKVRCSNTSGIALGSTAMTNVAWQAEF